MLRLEDDESDDDSNFMVVAKNGDCIWEEVVVANERLRFWGKIRRGLSHLVAAAAAPLDLTTPLMSSVVFSGTY